VVEAARFRARRLLPAGSESIPQTLVPQATLDACLQQQTEGRGGGATKGRVTSGSSDGTS